MKPRARDTSQAMSGTRQKLQRAIPPRDEGAADIGHEYRSDGNSRDTLPAMENDDIATITEPAAATEAPADLIEELLVEEISIDGMCGVY